MSQTIKPMLQDEPSYRDYARLRQGSVRPIFSPPDFMQQILPEGVFLGMLGLERKRAERSNKKFLLLLLDADDATSIESRAKILTGIINATDAVRRDTDPAGWYKENSILGVIFTELGALNDTATINKLMQRIREALPQHVNKRDLPYIHITAHIFTNETNDPDGTPSETAADPAFYPDLFYQYQTKKFAFLAKRAIDIVGSAMALLVLAPLFVVIAALVKLTSKGPILFKQERLGQFGKTFKCLKFRSMHANNDLKIHQEFMKNLISGSYEGKSDGSTKKVFKMTNDPRITRVGRFLRRSSLDELPQFFNVLMGEMSLVGPRPPLFYEYKEYDLWHRRRVLEVKPGITGLWQVNGRSRVSFNEMVRLDLRYARSWSLLLDLQILIKTPLAVIFGDGAY
ncbi:MAG TPA: sugar transferase [Candidatus Acidoferrales bacterium]|nr:sugar transferase [Candidatus Acidoferrales bacterium]